MPDEISLQADVGQLTLQGLSSFSTLLATLTADDVNPMAMIQMENLGAAFPINGEYATQVPDLLQRCCSSRLERLGLVLGWRKGDAASLMAKSAGGQAIALLATSLENLFPRSGDILLGLSQKILPPSIAISSGAQLGQVAHCLAAKLATLGFRNILASQASRIHDVYVQLQKPVPSDLLDVMSTESAIDLLHAVSRALREEDLLVRISGTQAIGYIFTLVMMLFHDDCLVTVDNFLVHEGPNKKILIEIGIGSEERPTEVSVETVLRISQGLPLPLVIEPREPRVMNNMGHFAWEGWVADRLQLEFIDQGVKCTEKLCIAISNLLVLLPAEMKGKPLYQKDQPLPRLGLVSLLGNHPHYRMLQTCQKVFRIPPIEPLEDAEKAFMALVQVFESDTQHRISCSCGLPIKGCNPSQGWKEPPENAKKAKGCKLRVLWAAVGHALDNGLMSFFVEAGLNATIRDSTVYGTGLTTDFINSKYGDRGFYIGCGSLHSKMMSLVSSTPVRFGEGYYDTLACSDSSTLYPSGLRKMSLDRENAVSYDLLDGKLQLNGRYHKELRSPRVPERPKAKRSLYAHKGLVKPTSFGEHSDLLLTVHERSNSLEISCVARFSGSTVRLHLGQELVASYGLEETEPCTHPRTDSLSPERLANVMTTSVAAPRAQGKKIAIVQTAGNETAQLLSCQLSVPAIIQRSSCLNCSYDEANGYFRMIIVG